MTKRVEVKTGMTAEMLYERYRKATDPVERTHWHMLWQVKEGKSPQEVAELFGYTPGWVRRMVRRPECGRRSRDRRSSSRPARS